MAGRLSKGGLPKLTTRGTRGLYCFRVRLNGKDVWVATRTAKLGEAEAFRQRFLESRQKTRHQATAERSAYRLADKVVKDLTGSRVERLAVADAFDRWATLAPESADMSARLRTQYKGCCDRLAEWCAGKSIGFVDQLTPEVARGYASHLWASEVTARTFNLYVGILSRLFASLDAALFLPCRNPFSRHVVPRKALVKEEVARHGALEPDQADKVIAQAAAAGGDYRDLLVLGRHTGMRLKDAVLLRWQEVEKDFIEVRPFKTRRRTAATARVPIAPPLRQVLDERAKGRAGGDEHVFPALAADYVRCPARVTARISAIFRDALGKASTNVPRGQHRKNRSSVLSFHSFRVTMTSLLARHNVPVRDAMRMMGWETMQMVLDYERELKRSREEADARALQVVTEIGELNREVPAAVPVAEDLPRPTATSLRRLVTRYSNVAIGRIFGMTSTAVKKHMVRHGIARTERIESPDLTDDDISRIRAELRQLEHES